MTNQFRMGDVIFVDGLPYEIGEALIARSTGAPLSLLPVRLCEMVGCQNVSLPHTTSVGTATSVRVCAACAEAM